MLNSTVPPARVLPPDCFGEDSHPLLLRQPAELVDRKLLRDDLAIGAGTLAHRQGHRDSPSASMPSSAKPWPTAKWPSSDREHRSLLLDAKPGVPTDRGDTVTSSRSRLG